MRRSSNRLLDFAHNIVYNRETLGRAYIHAGYATNENSRVMAVNAGKLFKTTACQKEISRLQKQLAAEIQAERAETTAVLIIDRLHQTNKLEDLRQRAEEAHDLTTALGCIKEQDAIYGLRLDVQADGNEKLEEISQEIKEQAKRLSPEIFSSLTNPS